MRHLGLMEEPHATLNRMSDGLVDDAINMQKQLDTLEPPLKIVIDNFEIELNEKTQDLTLVEAYESVLLFRSKESIKKFLVKRYGDRCLTKDEFMAESLFGAGKTNDAAKVFGVEDNLFDIDTVSSIIANDTYQNIRMDMIDEV